MKRNRIIVFLVLTILTLSLFGCSGNKTENEPSYNRDDPKNSTEKGTDVDSGLTEDLNDEEPTQVPNTEPILIIINHRFVGEFDGISWNRKAAAFEDANRNNSEFYVYQESGYKGSGKAIGSEYSSEIINISGFEDIYEYYFEDFVALSNNGNAQKRVCETGDDKIHTDILTDVLHEQGLDRFTPNVTAAIDVDLDGDGDKELLTIGTFYSAADILEEGIYRAEKNYSVFIYSEYEDGKYKSRIMSEAQRYKIRDQYALEQLNIDEDTAVIDKESLSVIDCIDINSDDVLEVIIKEETFGGENYVIYEFSDGKPEMVLEYFVGY